MGLVLVMAIAVDSRSFCAETLRAITRDHARHLAGDLTTLLSFGLLGASSAAAVRAFGFTMLIGILSAYFLAPLASRAATGKRTFFH